VDINIVKKNARGDLSLHWDISYSEKYGDARQLAYRLDTLVINRRIHEYGRPVPKAIYLGSLRSMAVYLVTTDNASGNYQVQYPYFTMGRKGLHNG
jgi:hypothetical protein